MKSADMAVLRSRWDALITFYGVDKTQADEVFSNVVAYYEENGRYYHNLRHIQNVLETIDLFRACAQDIEAIQLAAWFHDVIYDVHRTDNEEQSAVYAADALRQLGIPQRTIAKVSDMILATKHNSACPTDIDCQIMLDADLATFASDWELQEEIERAIRQEYAFVPDAAYRQGRQLILQNFLKRERIYCTGLMHAQQEGAARQNISRTIETLRA